ncbi:MAG: hypothetical protein C0424_01945 [Sphingobacteriaceae bacterium]|nr:hypothetical protein [Sphingobacteriaceae bacterium]
MRSYQQFSAVPNGQQARGDRKQAQHRLNFENFGWRCALMVLPDIAPRGQVVRWLSMFEFRLEQGPGQPVNHGLTSITLLNPESPNPRIPESPNPRIPESLLALGAGAYGSRGRRFGSRGRRFGSRGRRFGSWDFASLPRVGPDRAAFAIAFHCSGAVKSL